MLIQRAKLHSNIRQQNNVGTITKYVKSICIYIDKKTENVSPHVFCQNRYIWYLLQHLFIFKLKVI